MASMTPTDVVLIALMVGLVFAPPKWDLAIRWKERQAWPQHRWTREPALGRVVIGWVAYLLSVALVAGLVLR